MITLEQEQEQELAETHEPAHLLNPEDEGTHDGEREILRVPLSLWRAAGRSTPSAGKRWVLGRSDDALQYELMMRFCAGVLRQRLRDRVTPQVGTDERPAAAAPARAPSA